MVKFINNISSRIKILVAFVLASSFVFSQTRDSTLLSPYNPKGNYQTWGFRIFHVPLPIGNQGTLANTFGFDWGFRKKHSLGIESNILLTEGSHDQIHDTAGNYHEVGGFYHSVNVAALLNYRYYFDLKKMRKVGFSLYMGCFIRYGYVIRKRDPLYVVDDYINQKQIDYSGGAVIGFVKKFPRYKGFGFDFNICCSFKEKDTYTEYIENHVIKNKIEKPTVFVPRFDFSLYWWFYHSMK